MSRTLVLIPTGLERDFLLPRLEPALSSEDCVELCGFGLVAAAARTSQLVERLRPDRLLLVGIAGTYRDDLPPGCAVTFSEVTCFGIGAGDGADHQTVGDMGWNHIGGLHTDNSLGDTIVSDRIALRTVHSSDDELIDPLVQLLSVAAASGNAQDAGIRCRRFPEAAAEDMEGFAVALSGRLAGIEVAIVRGISNRAGDRDMANWQIEPALQAAADEAVRALEEFS